MKNRLKNKIVAMIMLSAVIMLLTASAAFADTLTLPSGLKEIEDEAFMNAASLDTVIVPEGVSSIGSRAFSGTGISQLSLPASLEQIGTDAFSGCEDMTVTAPEGCLAYEWALKNGYLKGEKDSETQVILPETIQAGEDLTVSVIGASNTVRHGVYLVNDQGKTEQYRTITKTSGIVTFEGYMLDTGIYRIAVYTVTNTFKILSPISKQFSVNGTKPLPIILPDLPESISAFSHAFIRLNSSEKVFSKITIFDANNNIINSYTELYSNPLSIWTDYEELNQGGTIEIEYSIKDHETWCSKAEKTIIITPCSRLGTPDIIFPEEITAGKDLLLSIKNIPEMAVCQFDIYSENTNQRIYSSQQYASSECILLIPGYLLDNGQYHLNVSAYNDDADNGFSQQSYKDYSFNVNGIRTGPVPEISSDDYSVLENESLHFSCFCSNANRIIVNYHYQYDSNDGYDEYISYYLDETGEVYVNHRVSSDFKYITVCSEQNGEYSAWSTPLS